MDIYQGTGNDPCYKYEEELQRVDSLNVKGMRSEARAALTMAKLYMKQCFGYFEEPLSEKSAKKHESYEDEQEDHKIKEIKKKGYGFRPPGTFIDTPGGVIIDGSFAPKGAGGIHTDKGFCPKVGNSYSCF